MTKTQAQIASEVTLSLTSVMSTSELSEYVMTLRLSVEPVSWKYPWAEVVVTMTSIVTVWKRTTTGQRRRLCLVRANSPTQRNTYPRLKSKSERIKAKAASPPGSSS